MKMRHFLPPALFVFLAGTATSLKADSVWVDYSRRQIGVTISYDPAYRRLPYPGGDVPPETGVCTDVIIRALRQAGLDLQKAVHEDMKSSWDRYPKNWGLTRPDPNIDHRRVPNLITFFKRQNWLPPAAERSKVFRPGDVVTWDLGRGIGHIGFVSDRKTSAGVPLIIHNIGRGTVEEDLLFSYPITGHFRIPAPTPAKR
jgi:uncharacterized protein YijF (DUF1287 family)